MNPQRQIVVVVIALLGEMLAGCAHDEGYCGGSFKSEAELRRAYPGIADRAADPHAAHY